MKFDVQVIGTISETAFRMRYAFFDGDNIGPTLEILLIENKIIEAQQFSNNIKLALKEIEDFVLSVEDAKLVIIGGDDILLYFNSQTHNINLLERIRDAFRNKTGNTMSCGVGKSLSEAIYNLRLAKIYGKDAIKGWS